MKKYISVITIMVLLLSVKTSVITYAKSSQELKESQQQINNQKEDLQNNINQVIIEEKSVSNEIMLLDENIGVVEQEIDRLDGIIADKEKLLSDTEDELKDAQEARDKHYETLKKRMKYIYENGNIGYLDVIMNFTSFVDLLNRIEYISDIITYDQEVLEEMKELEINIEDKIEVIDCEKKEIELLAKEQVDKKHSLELVVEQKTQVITKLKTDEAEYAKQLEQKEAENKEIEKLIKAAEAREEAERIAAAKKAAAEAAARAAAEREAATAAAALKYANGKLLWPIDGYYNLSSYFGRRLNPFTGKTIEEHGGIDIPAPKGTNVRAAESGTVLTSQYSPSYGNYVLIYHGDGISTLYAHNSKLLVSVGTTVKRGDVIALVGSTGDSTGNHSHFEVRINGVRVDPLPYVK